MNNEEKRAAISELGRQWREAMDNLIVSLANMKRAFKRRQIMNLDIRKQDDGSFHVVAVSIRGKVLRIGTIHRLDDAAALFAWKERNDGLQRQLDSARARLISLADALGMRGRDISDSGETSSVEDFDGGGER